MAVRDAVAESVAVPAADLPVLTQGQRQVAGVLVEVHDVTVSEVATVAGVSKSTAAKTLVLLESVGAACRTVHSDGEIRMADTWSPTPITGQLLVAEAASGGTGDGHADTLGTAAADTASDAHASVALGDGDADGLGDGLSAAEDLGVADPQPAHEPDLTGTAVTDAVVVKAAPEAAVVEQTKTESGGLGRLASGGLAALVADVLAAHPDIDFSPTMISHRLGGRSSGAISNALERQVKAGTAVRTCEAPRRYRHAA